MVGGGNLLGAGAAITSGGRCTCRGGGVVVGGGTDTTRVAAATRRWRPRVSPAATRGRSFAAAATVASCQANAIGVLGAAAGPWARQPHHQQQQHQHQHQHQQHQQQQQLRTWRQLPCRSRRQQPRVVCGASSWDQLPDPWDTSANRSSGGGGGNGGGVNGGGGSRASTATTTTTTSAAGASPPPPPPPPPPSGDGGRPDYGATDWGWDGGDQGWDPSEGLSASERAALEADYAAQLARARDAQDPPRDKWITPLLDWQSIAGAFDPDQSRTEGAMADEALTNKSESREALAFLARLVAVPLVTGALVGRALADPILSFALANNADAFAMTSHQKVEGAQRVHQEEARVRMLMAIGQAPPMDEVGMMRHLREYAKELQEEERRRNEAGLVTLVCDSVSLMAAAVLYARDNEGRSALASTVSRLFEGLSDIAKAVLIILIADTSLGYHSEEGWTALIDITLGHYGIEVAEKSIVLFVGIIPIAIDVAFKYWIFKGLNKISPGAVVTIKALDRH